MPRSIYHRVGQTNRIKIISVDGDNSITDAQENVVVLGKNFLAAQGSGKAELWSIPNKNLSPTKVEQSIDSWSDTSIQVDIDTTGLV